MCQTRFKEGSSPLSCKKRLPCCSHHHSAAFQGHSCDWRDLMCILPELNLILGALPRASYVRFKPPPSSTSIFFLSLPIKQTETELLRLEKLLHARLLHSWEIMCGSVLMYLSQSDCAACILCFVLFFPGVVGGKGFEHLFRRTKCDFISVTHAIFIYFATYRCAFWHMCFHAHAPVYAWGMGGGREGIFSMHLLSQSCNFLCRV